MKEEIKYASIYRFNNNSLEFAIENTSEAISDDCKKYKIILIDETVVSIQPL